MFDLVNNLRKWRGWSPWEKLDPAMQRSFSGAPAQAGAIYSWQGNKDVGSGRMEVKAAAPDKVSIQLEPHPQDGPRIGSWQAAIAELNKAANDALKTPEVASQLSKFGVVPTGGTAPFKVFTLVGFDDAWKAKAPIKTWVSCSEPY